VLIARDAPPEWRQLMVLAAFRRADAVARLPALPDRAPPRALDADSVEVAGVPNKGNMPDADGGDVTESIGDGASELLPVEIGEPASAELPLHDAPEQPPVVSVSDLTPQQPSHSHGASR
jgi:hypothetical protein